MLQVTLFIGPYKFRKRAVRKNGVVQFTCCSCESEAGSVVSAYAEEILKEDGSSSYILNSYPSHSEHLCIRNGFENYIEKAVFTMYKMIHDDSEREVTEIYKTAREACYDQFSGSSKMSLMAQFPPFRSLQAKLYGERRCFIPANPKTQTDLDVKHDLFLYNKESKESMVKGDTILTNGKRIVFFSSNEHLDLLARGAQILGDGTFKTTPSLWYQTFIVSVQVDSETFCPCAFFLLPDKTKDSYLLMFDMLKEALTIRNLEPAANYFMSDFEVAIRDSFMEMFPGIDIKSCVFHWSKLIISKVASKGFKSDYSDPKNNGKFVAFILGILGLPYVPLNRFKEAVRNCFILANRLTGRQKRFAKEMLDYLQSVWLTGWSLYNC